MDINKIEWIIILCGLLSLKGNSRVRASPFLWRRPLSCDSCWNYRACRNVFVEYRIQHCIEYYIAGTTLSRESFFGDWKVFVVLHLSHLQDEYWCCLAWNRIVKVEEMWFLLDLSVLWKCLCRVLHWVESTTYQESTRRKYCSKRYASFYNVSCKAELYCDIVLLKI